MASLGQIIYRSMIVLIVLFASIIIIILVFTFIGTTSDVLSTNTAPVANLGQDELLSCFLHSESGRPTISELSVTWEREEEDELVYQYEDGAPVLQDQSSQFRERTELFPSALIAGNASLLLRKVRSSDEGEYTCSIGSADGRGSVNIHLRTAAFSTPSFNFSKGVLRAEASRWFPKPNVTWLDSEDAVLEARTSFSQGTGGIYTVTSELQPVNTSTTYTCRIENLLVLSVSQATVTDSGVWETSYFNFSSSSPQLSSSYISIVTGVFCITYLG